MHLIKIKISALLLVMVMLVPLAANADKKKKLAVDKVKGNFSVLVLGSGGPRAADNGRAGSGFLIFVDGKPRIMMEMGGGTFKSLAQSGALIPDLDLFLLTHLHLDHTADMSAMVKTVFFHNRAKGVFRTAPLNFYGPEANGIPFPPVPLPDGAGIPQYPPLTDYVHGHYNIKTGVERYLNAFTLGTKTGRFNYTAMDLPSDFNSDAETTFYTGADGLVIKSIAVSHGPVPAVAYRIEYDGKSIVWSGDTRSLTGNMAKISAGADLLIYDTAIMADDPPPGTIFHSLHTIPERMGEVAVEANPKTLLLSHITAVSDPRIKEVKSIVRSAGYTGKIKEAKDLMVINLDRRGHHDHH
jgi:ribonuclease BN (tRNA processing enzyme)